MLRKRTCCPRAKLVFLRPVNQLNIILTREDDYGIVNSSSKPVLELVKFFLRKTNVIGCDVVSVCRQSIKSLFSLFARTNSPSGKQALDYTFLSH